MNGDVVRRATNFYDKVHNETYGIDGNKAFSHLVEAVNHVSELLTLIATPEATVSSEDSVEKESSRPQGLHDYVQLDKDGNPVKASTGVHYDPTGQIREPPHCPSCHCETPSMLDQIRQNDKNTHAAWFKDAYSDTITKAFIDRRWLLGEVDRLRADLSQWEKQTKGQVWVSTDEYARLMSRSEMLNEVEHVLSQPVEDTFRT